MKFLSNKVIEVQDIPMRLKEGGGYYPVESTILREYRKISIGSGIDIYQIAAQISKNDDIKNDDGRNYTFQESINLVTQQDPRIFAHYGNEVKKAFYSTLEMPEKLVLVSALMNTRVAQSWHVKNRKAIEKGLSQQPSLEGWDIVFPDFEETFALSLLNSSEGSKPLYNEKNGKLYWTLQQTFRLDESVIDEIYQKVFLDSVPAKDVENDDEDVDFLLEDSEES